MHVERRGEQRFFGVLRAQRISTADGTGAPIAAAGSAFGIRNRKQLADKSEFSLCRVANRAAAEEGGSAQEGDQEETDGIGYGTSTATRRRADCGPIRTAASISLAYPLTDDHVL